ncbi:phosphatase PAP2 family protein [Adhaeribacter aquaticus]|uniref:phosphatase PAP2 family protein n=1 Tax=Adhaeribacter aquaticus TaxID=299567 RepID=UPI00041E98B1|nr:phosphatase PAP2 family protein [Adhaeribacter aquaticus]
MKYLLLLLLLCAQISYAQSDSTYTSDSQLPAGTKTKPAANEVYNYRKAGYLNAANLDTLPYRNVVRSNVDVKSLVLPSLMLGYGLITLNNRSLLATNEFLQDQLQEQYPGFNSKLDDYTRYVPLAAVYGLNLAGVKGKNDLVNMSMLFVLSSFLSNTFTKNLKNMAKEQRPNNTTFDSFPSLHTSSAFAKAELLRQEYKHLSPWYGIAGYSFAVATGAMRMLNNRHWFSDVVAGAGVGILSTRIAYVVYPWLQEKIAQGRYKQLMVVPTYERGGFGLGMSYNLNQKQKR